MCASSQPELPGFPTTLYFSEGRRRAFMAFEEMGQKDFCKSF